MTGTKPLTAVPAACVRKIYRLIGFSKGYNFALWLILGGGLFSFSLVQLRYLDFFGIFCGGSASGDGADIDAAAPGECFYYLQPGRYQIGMILHLACILPAGLMSFVQFIPGVRRRAIGFHRVNGYIVVALSVLGTIGCLIIARRAMGGSIDTQAMVGLESIIFLGSLALGCIYGSRRQIEKHRAWMLRAWVYAAAIVTMRVVMTISIVILSFIGGYYMPEPCDKINFMLKSENETLALYPGCAPFLTGEAPDQHVVVPVNVFTTDPVQHAAAINVVFGMSGWVAIALHAFCCELYLHLTSAEHERLRSVSHRLQLAAGMKNPDRASLTADRLDGADQRPLKRTEEADREVLKKTS
ncbi:hypothetical protein AAE478_010037 [Parahypoxylon ruwenzoriense]